MNKIIAKSKLNPWGFGGYVVLAYSRYTTERCVKDISCSREGNFERLTSDEDGLVHQTGRRVDGGNTVTDTACRTWHGSIEQLIHRVVSNIVGGQRKLFNVVRPRGKCRGDRWIGLESRRPQEEDLITRGAECQTVCSPANEARRSSRYTQDSLECKRYKSCAIERKDRY